MRFLDTNIFIRFITGDDPTKAAACLDLFQRLRSGAESCTTCEAVITEVVYVCSSRATYNLPSQAIRARLAPLLALPGLRIADKGVHLRALDLLVEHPTLDFEDMVLAAHMERSGESEIYSYDRDFDRIPGVRRIEPGGPPNRP